jgi:hypothetical protein
LYSVVEEAEDLLRLANTLSQILRCPSLSPKPAAFNDEEWYAMLSATQELMEG